jgi:hypothetical protein
MKRATCVVSALVFLILASPQSASADASCGMYAEGSLTDVFANTVWSGSSLLDVGTQPDAATCSTKASHALTNHAYSTCVQRPSGVNLDLSGDVYFNGEWVQQQNAPASCRAGFGLNSYTALGSGSALSPGASITSPNGWYTFTYQADGNLVTYQGSTVIWAGNCWPGCANWGSPGVATMQTDGNFVVTNSSGVHVWMSATSGWGAFLALRDDGEVAIYAVNGNRLWSSVQGHSRTARRGTGTRPRAR